jgi:hypothetical protein
MQLDLDAILARLDQIAKDVRRIRDEAIEIK